MDFKISMITTTGKTFLTKMIAETIYEKGINSVFYKIYMSSKDFPDEKKVLHYKVRFFVSF